MRFGENCYLSCSGNSAKGLMQKKKKKKQTKPKKQATLFFLVSIQKDTEKKSLCESNYCS